MVLYNYSSLRKRDKKIYSMGNTKVSSTGLSVEFLKVVAPCTIATTVIGIVINAILGTHFFNPFGGHFSLFYVILSIGSGLGLGLAGWYIKLDSYRLYEYLMAYLKPKKTYHNLNYGKDKEYKLYKYTTKGIIQSDL